MAHRLRIRTNDEVIVISGKDKGRTGKVLRVDAKRDRVYVEGINIVKRHQAPSAANPNAAAGVIEKEGPIHISNVAINDGGKPSRVRIARRDDGRRMRVTKRSGKELD
jgi:large subunit ribosomal protein L24